MNKPKDLLWQCGTCVNLREDEDDFLVCIIHGSPYKPDCPNWEEWVEEPDDD